MSTPSDDLAKADRTHGNTLAAHPGATLDGPLLRTLFADACSLLQRHVQALNAINVFPVPDGDTGTNLYLTLRAGVDGAAGSDSDDLAAISQALAHGALMGARGNSGVILSQILRGFSAALDGQREADGPTLAKALASATEAAYGALSEPIEGTILTVVREAAQSVAEHPPATAQETLAKASTAARAAVERTPELLPVLKEAGVVDAGGLGLAIVLEGLRRSLSGESLEVDLAPEITSAAGWQDEAATLHQVEHGESGYCTEFMVSGDGLEAAPVRERLSSLGSSLLVVGEGKLLRVHLHTTAPDDALAYGRTLGQISQVKVDNMETQIQRFASGEPPRPITSAIDIVAVAAGEGIEAAFRSVGVTQLVRGGQTMNPSAAEILEAIESCRAEQVVVLPNNKNIIAAAQQAADSSEKLVSVVPSRSLPQGVSAVLALNPDLGFDENAEAMERALASVRSAEVTRAVRATTIDGRRIEMGQAIGVVEGAVRAVADDLESAVLGCVTEMLAPESSPVDASLLTIYIGRDVRDEDAEAMAQTLRDRHPQLEIELVHGGQPHYPYILSLE